MSILVEHWSMQTHIILHMFCTVFDIGSEIK